MVSSFLPFFNVAVMSVSEVLRHQLIDSQPLKLFSCILKQRVSIFAGPLDFSTFEGNEGSCIRTEQSQTAKFDITDNDVPFMMRLDIFLDL